MRAPTGQTVTHVAHVVQVSPILRQDSTSSIELVGQTATQAPQCPHFSMFTVIIVVLLVGGGIGA
ncbi:MAG TPA: hypothetical protein VED16_00685 [Candidatus Acidoferrum sp.]|nr:hypothetical protein [Candidatus Acidoferrum sp.]